MPVESNLDNKTTVIYSPLRLNWRNVILGTVIGALIIAIAGSSFYYYNLKATPVPPVVIKKATPSAQIATPSASPATPSAVPATPSAKTQ